MKCIVLLAPPAAGKGTIARYIQDKFNYKQISTGDLLREEAKANEAIRDLIKNGNFVSDELVLNLFKNYVSSLDENLILDGIPRNINQAVELGLVLDEFNIELERVIFIDIDKEIAANRACNRLICDKCKKVYNKELVDSKICISCGGNLISRDDDTKEVYINRYNTYMKETNPLISYYKSRVIEINNNGKIEDLFKKIDKIFEGDGSNDNN